MTLNIFSIESFSKSVTNRYFLDLATWYRYLRFSLCATGNHNGLVLTHVVQECKVIKCLIFCYKSMFLMCYDSLRKLESLLKAIQKWSPHLPLVTFSSLGRQV